MTQSVSRLYRSRGQVALAALFLFGASTAMAKTPAPSQAGLSNAAWASLLETYVSEGSGGVNLVDYGALKANDADRAKLNDYIGQFSDIDFDALSRDAQFSAWANLYNAVTVRYIVNEYPTDSIKPWIGSGPWKKIKVEADGREISLKSIEDDMLRAQWPDDPRLHYAINCASYSCPNLRVEPWAADTLDADLDEAARDYVNNPRGVKVEKNGLQLSSIYKWYKDDFGGTDASIIDHLLKYAGDDLAAKIKADPDIRDHDYDWSLNGTDQ